MDDTAVSAAASIIYQHLRNGSILDNLADNLRPQNRAEGYQIQACLEMAMESQRQGWKIAATSIAGQKHIGLNGPIAGRIVEDMMVNPGQPVPFGANRMRVAEAEFVFCMKTDLLPRPNLYETAEVMAGVASLHLGLEFPDSRFADFVAVGEGQLIADNACGYKFMMGEAVSDIWRDMTLSTHPVIGRVTGSDGQLRAEYKGSGGNVLDCPTIALTWLVNELSAQNIPLRAGEFVTTGTTTLPMAILPGDQIEANFGALGRISCQLSS